MLIHLDPHSTLSLQRQLRQKLVEVILSGALPPARRLPSSRKLADQLGVSRNTVTLAYQRLLEEGYLVSRERSGIYVNPAILETRVEPPSPPPPAVASPVWKGRFRHRYTAPVFDGASTDRERYPYTFIDGPFDATLYPVAEWREATRLALGVREINEWSVHADASDDSMLIDEIRSKILPARGIQADADQIMVTAGAQQALFLIVQLLVDQNVRAAVESPSHPDVRQLLLQFGADLVHQPVDEAGLVVDDRLDGIDVAFVTPSHQVPTAVTMSLERRQALLKLAAAQDFLIVEDDVDCESSYLGYPEPALRSLDSDERVVYVSALSKALAPALRLGFVVAHRDVIRELRLLRRLILRYAPLNDQRTAAFFLSLGHYDAVQRRVSETFRQRWLELRDALNHYLPTAIVSTPARGGTAYWVRGAEGLDVDALARKAAERGILIEPVGHYYAGDDAPRNCFRMGITNLPVEMIRAGVARLAALIRESGPEDPVRLEDATGTWLTGSALVEALSGARLLHRTIYGDPCTIELLPDGEMLGRAGHDDEDQDSGRWWVDGERWFRQWQTWSFGEAAGFFTVVDGDHIKWFNSRRVLVDSAVLHGVSAAGPLKLAPDRE